MAHRSDDRSDGVACSSCRFASVDYLESYECRRHAPQWRGGTFAGDILYGLRVEPQFWCGEWEPHAKSSDPSRE